MIRSRMLWLLAMAALLGFQSASAADPVNVFDEAKLEVPAEWTEKQPASQIIEREFTYKSGEGDDAPSARITMMASGGGIKANIERWKGQFTGGKADEQKTETKQIGKWNVHVVDLSGNFAESMGGGPFSGGKVVQRQNYAMNGVIVEHPKGQTYFIKVTGPADVVKANRPAVMKMLEGLK